MCVCEPVREGASNRRGVGITGEGQDDGQLTLLYYIFDLALDQ